MTGSVLKRAALMTVGITGKPLRTSGSSPMGANITGVTPLTPALSPWERESRRTR